MDFFSLILSIKGLYDYIKEYCPQCTEYIPFELEYFNPKRLYQVSSVQLLTDNPKEAIEDLPSFLEVYESEDVLQLLQKVFDKFPNLRRLKVSFARKTHHHNTICVDIPNNSWNLFELVVRVEQKSLPLKVLHLSISKCDLKIYQHFPYLEKVVLSSIGEYVVDYSSPQITKLEGFNQYYKLEVDWEKLPKLQILVLFGWKLGNSLFPLINRLEILELDYVKPFDNVGLVGFEKLHTLKLFHRSCEEFKSVCNLKNLNSLTLESKTRGERWFNLDSFILHESFYEDNFCIYLRNFVSIQEFPNLRYIRIVSKELFPFESENKDLVIFDHQNLEEIYLERCYFSVRISNTPKLMILRAEKCKYSDESYECTLQCYSIEHCSGMKLRELKLDGARLSENLIHNICLFDTLENIKIIDEYDHDNDGCIDDKYDITFDNFPKLRKLHYKVMNSAVKRVSNCPVLEILEIHEPTKDCIIFNVPELKNVKFTGTQDYEYNEETRDHTLIDKSSNIKIQLEDQLKTIETIQFKK